MVFKALHVRGVTAGLGERKIQAWPWLCRAVDLPAASWISSDRRGQTSSSRHSTTPAGPVLAVSGGPRPSSSVSAHAEYL